MVREPSSYSACRPQPMLSEFASCGRFMRSYPKEGEADLIFDGIVKALGKGLDAQKMKDDCKTLAAWAEGKTEDDVIAAMTGEGERCVLFVVGGDGIRIYPEFYSGALGIRAGCLSHRVTNQSSTKHASFSLLL